MNNLKEIIKAIIEDEFARSDCSNCKNAKNGVGGLDIECDYCNIRNGSGWVMSDSAADKVVHNILGRIEKDGKYRWHDLRKNPEDLPTEEKYYDCVLEDCEEDLHYPSFMYDTEYGFGVWRTIYDPDTLGVIDDEFLKMEDIGCSEVIAWREICLFESGE